MKIKIENNHILYMEDKYIDSFERWSLSRHIMPDGGKLSSNIEDLILLMQESMEKISGVQLTTIARGINNAIKSDETK